MAVIEARGVEKKFRVAVKQPGLAGAFGHLFYPRYRDVIALARLDLTVQPGESVAYAGPNGAGKSTTMKLLTGILVPTAGELRVLGLSPHRHRAANARNIGVVFGQRPGLWWDLPVRDSFRLLGDMYQVPATLFARNLEELVDALELASLLPLPTRQLSLGQRMRCDLAAMLLHSPTLLFLDEPTIGLDVEVRERVRQLLRKKHREGVTMLLTSHDLDDVESLCERLVLINHGEVAFDGSLVKLRAEYGMQMTLRLVFKTVAADAAERITGILERFAGAAWLHRLDAAEAAIVFDANRVTAGELAERLLPVLPVHDLRIEEPGLEEILQRMYQRGAGVAP